jgi:TonB-linked SusC/RagA family outer membrane protein
MKQQLIAKIAVVVSLLTLFTGVGNAYSAITPQQPLKIEGVVTDTGGAPVAGAYVMQAGTNNATITNDQGYYTLNVPGNASVVVSFLGYVAQVVPVNNRTTIDVTLTPDTTVMDEVVVLGFGSQRKVNLTGSVGIATAEDLETRPVATATQALQGLVPGLDISQNQGLMNSRPTMNIRGIATIGSGSTGGPLILIDGMEGDINIINPQDIESISVLKDAAASSIYGSRAPFGVVLVTTKKGKAGKAQVNYNNSFRWSTPTLMNHLVDSYTFALYYNEANANNGEAERFDAEHLQRILDYQSGKLKSSIPVNAGNPQFWADGFNEGNDNVDWYDKIYKEVAFSQEHNFSVQGGSDNVTYYMSLNYLDQNGFLKLNEDTFDRYNGTARINARMSKWAQMNYNGRWTREDYQQPTFVNDNFFHNIARQGWPTVPYQDPNGFLYNSPSPALNLRDMGIERTQQDNLSQQLQFVLEPVENWITNVEFNYRTNNRNFHRDNQTTYNHDVNGNPYRANVNSFVREEIRKDNFMNFNAYSEYSFTLGESHNVKAMAGFQAEQFDRKSYALQRTGIIVPGQPVIDLTTGINANGGVVAPTVEGDHDQWATAGFFGRLNYDYDGKYLAEVNLRYDGTSRFRADNRWILFPSVSLGWNIAYEDFWSPLKDYVGTLKLRASFGNLGNQNTSGWYPTYTTMNVGASNGNWFINNAKPNTARAPGLISSTMTWERVSTTNFGLDFGAFRNRLTGSFDYYVRKTLDMIGPAPTLPITLGTAVPRTNNTDLKTYGWELTVGWNDRLENGLRYGVRMLLSDSQTEITRYPNETGSLASGQFNAGRKMGEIWGYETIGIAKTAQQMQEHLAGLPNGGQNALGNRWDMGDIMYADLNGDGKIDGGANTLTDHGDLIVIGNNTPRYRFGLDLTAGWKGFDFRAFFQGVMKRDFWRNEFYMFGASSTVWESTAMHPHMDYFRASADHPLGQNLDGYFARPQFNRKNQQTQTRYLQNASYIRLKNLQIGYTLPQTVTDRLNVSRVRVYLSGENLWTMTKMFETFDPEQIDGGWNGSVYPLSRTISAGVSLTF